jgi:adenylate cyclase
MPLPHERSLPARIEDIMRGLRSRRLDRIAVGYAVSAWIIVQGASIVVPSFNGNAQLVRVVIIFFLLAFPITLVGAWFATPHIGMAYPRKKPSKAGYAIFAASTLILAAIAADLSLLLSRIQPERVSEPAVANLLPPKNSIAVLPFANMSGDPKKDYFSDGIADEVLDDLAGTPQLQVAARTSSFAFKNKNNTIKDIARLLSVRSVLEGSVRESGQHLRISGELIDATSGYHLWSATYNRDLTDILAVEEEIAQAITSALTKQLFARSGHVATDKRIDPAAYRAYLLGKRDLEPRTAKGAEASIPLFKQTVSHAPQFADGFAALADADVILADKLQGRSDLISSAEIALSHALQIDPNNIDALSTRLDLSLHKLDWAGARRDARRLQRAAPNSAKVLHEMFRFYEFMAFPDLALAAAQSAARLNPLSFADRFNVETFLLHDARFSDAIVAGRAALAQIPHQPVALAVLCVAAANAGQSELAHTTEKELSQSEGIGQAHSADDTSATLCEFALAAAEHRVREARTIIDNLAKGFPQSGIGAYDLGEKYTIVGDFEQAGLWFNRSYDSGDFLIFLLPGDKLVPPAFRDCPEYRALLDRPLFRNWQAAHDAVADDLATRDRGSN